VGALLVVLLVLRTHPLAQVAAATTDAHVSPIITALAIPTVVQPTPAPAPSKAPPPVVKPAPAPAPIAAPAPPPPPSAQGVVGIIEAAFASQGSAAVTWALRVARCESGYNPNATNPSSGAAGLFQFEPATWAHTPWAADSVYSPEPNALAAAWLYNQDHGAAWSCK